MKQMYFLNYLQGDAKVNIIGATSPATLFFSSANDLSDVSEAIRFGNDHPFDSTKPLFERDLEYQKYWYWMLEKESNFRNNFKEVAVYLDESFKILAKKNKEKHTALKTARENESLDKYSDITVGDHIGHKVEVINGLVLKKWKENPDDIEKNSGFVIDSEYKPDGQHRPLVLPIDTYNTRTIYTQDQWDSSFNAPYFDSRSMQDRTLPNDGSKYPYLTISDFLTDTIVQMSDEINKESFFDGNLDKSVDSNGNKLSYLLPLKDEFFKYFSTEQLRGTLKDGKKMFELKKIAGGVKALLRIPITDDKHIEYSRSYFEGLLKGNKIEKTNDGWLVKHNFVFALFPNIKFKSDKEAFYRFGIIPYEFDANNYKVKYANARVSTVENVRSEAYNTYLQCKNFILEESNFNYLNITCPDGISGCIIPIFKDCSGKNAGKEQFIFAIDFGTTNTHIEYRRGNQKSSEAFNIDDDKQIHAMTISKDSVYRMIYDLDFIPEKINNRSECKFPTRTALSAAKNHNFKNGALPFVQGNIAFWHEKRKNFDYNETITELKWPTSDEQQDEKDNENKVKCFIDSLCMILRNKVVLNNGDLSNTKLIWLYPISMNGNRLNLFKQKWQDAYKKYFGDNLDNLISLMESVAPYIYYKDNDENSTISDIVSIDIGGGTTDMVVVVNEHIKFVTSFRFAANAIFGNGYAGNKINGIIQQFKTDIEQVIKDANLRKVQDIYDDICKEKNSANIASFFFSLKNNWDIREADKKDNTKRSEQLDFQAILSANSSHKIIFALFYAAIIYHLANVMKSQNLGMPRHIAFSGNGSKTIQILSSENTILEYFTKLIFKKVNENYEERKLTIIQNDDNPKEVTSKGAILYDPDPKEITNKDTILDDPHKINYNTLKKVILQGTDDCSVFSKEEKYIDIDQDDYLNKAVEEVKRFLKIFIELLNENSIFMRDFGISYDSLEVVEEECFSEDLKTFATKGLNQKLKEVNPKQPIEETFFFYPLVGLLNSLSNEITKKTVAK
ncbi:MAG: cell division FtsA domain-containing protein [Candidatus Azobacteroides sp.]|nr:cell division FtsA domain-containing protein [Candidatus Azobacteroides sp.]